MGQKWAWNKPFDWTEKLNVSNVDQINFSRLTMDYICVKIKAGHNGALLGQISQLWCKTAPAWTWAHLLNGRTYLRTQKSEELIGCVKTRPICSETHVHLPPTQQRNVAIYRLCISNSDHTEWRRFGRQDPSQEALRDKQRSSVNRNRDTDFYTEFNHAFGSSWYINIPKKCIVFSKGTKLGRRFETLKTHIVNFFQIFYDYF